MTYTSFCVKLFHRKRIYCLHPMPHDLKDVLEKHKRSDIMGDKGGKKDKEKGQKQSAEKQKQKARDKFDKQPKRKP